MVMQELLIPQMPQGAIDAALAAPHGEARAKVITEAWSWIGTPWSHQNRAKGAGVDCGNYVGGVFTETGDIEAPELFVYPHDFYLHSDEERFRDIVSGFCNLVYRRQFKERFVSIAAEIPASETRFAPLPGDILSYALGKLSVSHLAIVIKWPVVVHALRHPAQAVISEDSNIGAMAACCSGIWRLKGWCDVR